MLRELSQVLDELYDGLRAVETRGGVALTRVDMTLPLELRPVFRNGGCTLLADLPRSREVNEWVAEPSKLSLAWGAPIDRFDPRLAGTVNRCAKAHPTAADAGGEP